MLAREARGRVGLERDVERAGPEGIGELERVPEGRSSARSRSSRAPVRGLRATSSWVRTDAKLTSLRVASMAGLTPASTSCRAWPSSSAAMVLSASRARTVSRALRARR